MSQSAALTKNALSLPSHVMNVGVTCRDTTQLHSSSKVRKVTIGSLGIFSKLTKETMNTNYFLCAARACITTDSKFFKVSVPSTKQGKRDRSYIEQYARENGYYWHVWDAETGDFYWKIAESLNMKLWQMPMTHIKARCLVAFIKEKKSLPPCVEVAREASRLRDHIEPNFHFLRQNKVIHQAEAEKRKKPQSVEVEIKVSLPK